MSIDRVSCMRAGSKVSGSAKARQRNAVPEEVPPLPEEGAVVLVACAAGADVSVACAAGAVVAVASVLGAVAAVGVAVSPPQAASEGANNRNNAGTTSFFLENILS